MPQSSITAWLKRPTVAKKNDEAVPTRPSDPLAEPPLFSPTPASPKGASKKTTAPDANEAQTAQTGAMFSLPPLPPNVELVPLTEELMPSFKRLNALTFPVAYPPAFYKESMMEPYHSITLMALWHSAPPSTGTASTVEKPRLVGAIRCRILPSANLYISTIGLLAPYRSHGIAAHLLQRVIVKASKEHGVKCVTAHVWEANEDGLEWYKKRGFEIIGKEDKYYSKLRPPGALLVRKWVGVADLLADADATSRA